jgi:hypothetical protein
VYLEQENFDDKNFVDDDASKIFTIERVENTSTYVIHNFRVTYQNRPHNLNNISMYEFANRLFIRFESVILSFAKRSSSI